MDTNQIALQLYTVREQTAQDMLGTLRQLAQMGYQAVEFAGYGGVPLRDIRTTLDEIGIRAVAAHVSLNDLDKQLQQVFSDMHTLGCEYCIVPSVPQEHRSSADQIRQLAERLNHLGTLCQAEGLHFGYHNHAFEFTPLDGSSLWEILTTATDPALVGLELDIYWAQFAGVDPMELIRTYAGRLPILHMKDMSSDSSRSDIPVGEGIFPWKDILQAGDTAGVRWYIIEQDHPQDAMNDVRISLHNLQQLMRQA